MKKNCFEVGEQSVLKSSMETKTRQNLFEVKCKSTTTLRSSSSTSAIATSIRPQTLNVSNLKDSSINEANNFILEALKLWKVKARNNIVPADCVQELFREMKFNPSQKQIGEIIQEAKVFARKGNKKVDGLTFGEFCVLAADLKRFRTSTFSLNGSGEGLVGNDASENFLFKTACPRGNNAINTTNIKNKTPFRRSSSSPVERIGPEVFLGGSCNPTTWRADVAIPILQKLGISFYNPQVSDWSPDLIELEHKAKEKARVLFFVMDSQTRATAGAIEAAHIAALNPKQLVLVLHPYKPDQCIFKEPISHEEYIDLQRNQQILRELVTRRGLSVLNDIQSGLEKTKEILAGIRGLPSNVASILKVVRGSFDRVLNLNADDISIQQCERALSHLGYSQNIIIPANLRQIIAFQKNSIVPSSVPHGKSRAIFSKDIRISFEEFCVTAAYFSVLQQEIHESGCTSPIKGINVPAPPIYLANVQEGFQRPVIESLSVRTSKQICRASSCSSVPDQRCSYEVLNNRDSGTSSPQPNDHILKHSQHNKKWDVPAAAGNRVCNVDEESDSNDSVFSSGSSINSITTVNSVIHSESHLTSNLEIRDIYLGGSCFLRTRWRQDIAIPFLQSAGVTYHIPALHESLTANSQLSQINNEQFIKTSSSNNTIGIHSTNGVDLSIETHYDQQDIYNFQPLRQNLYNPKLLDSSQVLLFFITNETRSLAPMTLAAHCIGLMYDVVLCVQMLPDNCIIGSEKLTSTAIKDYNRGRSYLLELAKSLNVPIFGNLNLALSCAVKKIKTYNSKK